MDEEAQLVHDNPLFSPTLHSQEKCWDVHEEITGSNNTPKISEGISGKNAGLMEEQLNFNSNSAQSSGKASGSNSGGGRHGKHQCVIEDDKEWEDLPESRTRVRKLLEEQEEDGYELYDKGGGNIMSYLASPVIIQARGVASYHPIYSPFACRPRFLRYRGSPSNEISETKRSLGQSIADIQRSAEKAQAEAERSDNDCLICQEGERYEGIEANVGESFDPQLAQLAHNLEEQRSEIAIEDSEPQWSAEPDDAMEPNSNSSIKNSINPNTVGFRRSRSVLCKMMLPLFLFLALATASSGFFYFGLLGTTTSYGGAKNMLGHKAHTNVLSHTVQFSLKNCYSWLWEFSSVIIPSEYMGGELNNSSRAVVNKYVDSVYLCSCSVFSYLGTCTGCMAKEFGTMFINFTGRFIGNLKVFCQDLLVGPRSIGEFQGFCKCLNSNRTVRLQTVCPGVISMNITSNAEIEELIEYDTNHGIQGNSSTEQIDLIQEPANSTKDAENHDQMVAEDQEISTVSEDSTALESFHSFPRVIEAQQVDLIHEPVVLPVTQESFNGFSQSPTAMLDQDNSSQISWKFVAILASVLIVLSVLIGTACLYFSWCDGQEMKMKNYMKKPKSRRRQTSDSPVLGSFVDYVDLPSSSEGCRSGREEIRSTPNRTAVRRSLRIRNKSLSPLPIKSPN